MESRDHNNDFSGYDRDPGYSRGTGAGRNTSYGRDTTTGYGRATRANRTTGYGAEAPYEKKEKIEKPYFLDKRVLITGSSSGIGRCLAFWYLNNGARVGLVGRDKDSLTEIGKQFPSQAVVIHCDLSDDKQQYEMAGGVIEKFGGLDILINCAGVIFEGDVVNTFPQDFDYICDMNVRLPFHLISLFQPFLEKSGGCIVNVSCINGHKPAQGAISY